jgi:hypothetical protein
MRGDHRRRLGEHVLRAGGGMGADRAGCAVAMLVYAATIVWLRGRATPQP